MTSARACARWLAATLFPPRCCLCGFPGASLDLDLCDACLAALPHEGSMHEGALVALRYEHPVDQLVRRLKYQGVIAHARVLGVLMARVVSQRGPPLPRLLVPVPLHAARWRERGFNQAAALARYAGLMLEVPVARQALVRVRNTPSQTTLARAERHRNVRGAFEVRHSRTLERMRTAGHIALIDDVMTTGSTLHEARAALLNAGVSRVDLWAVTRAP